MTLEFVHGTMEKCLGEDEAFYFIVECLLAIDQPTHFSDDPSNEEEAVVQVQQAIAASHEIAIQEPYVPFKGKCVIEDDKHSHVPAVGASSSVLEVGGSFSAHLE